MAKKDKKKKDDKGVEDAVAALRAAAERMFHASTEGAQSTRERTREIVDEIAAAAGRVRTTLEDMRVLDEVKRLRTEVETLASRVSKLEVRPPASTSTSTVKKPAAKRRATKRTATKKPAAKRTTTAKKRAAAKKPAAAQKPAASSGTS